MMVIQDDDDDDVTSHLLYVSHDGAVTYRVLYRLCFLHTDLQLRHLTEDVLCRRRCELSQFT